MASTFNIISGFYPWLLSTTPVIPKLYYDVYSDEQRTKEICKLLNSLIDYSDQQTKQINENTQAIKNVEQSFEETKKEIAATLADFQTRIKKFDARVTALEHKMNALEQQALIYDPTQGRYTASVNAMRNVINILATGENLGTCDDIAAKYTIETLANSGSCGDLLNRYFVFNTTGIESQNIDD